MFYARSMTFTLLFLSFGRLSSLSCGIPSPLIPDGIMTQTSNVSAYGKASPCARRMFRSISSASLQNKSSKAVLLHSTSSSSRAVTAVFSCLGARLAAAHRVTEPLQSRPKQTWDGHDLWYVDRDSMQPVWNIVDDIRHGHVYVASR